MKILLLTVLCCVLGARASPLHEPESRIIGGTNAAAIVPSHAHIRIFRGTDRFAGSGVLITTTVVVTVAQNVADFDQWACGFGSLQFDNLNWIGVNGFTVHGAYNPLTILENNIALLRLVSAPVAPAVPITYSNDLSFPAPAATGVISGFGITSNANSELSTTLVSAAKIITTPLVCQTAFEFLPAIQLDSHVCAQNTVNNANFCGGDQGAGLIVNGVLAAIASTVVQSNNCALNAPGLYVRVSSHGTWMNTLIANNIFTAVNPPPLV